MNLDDVLRDLSAFADDPSDVLIESGTAMLVRGGKDISFSLREEDGQLIVIQDQTKTPYRKFLGYNIAGLDIFAERLISKRTGTPAFVDGPAKVESVSLPSEQGLALELLDRECRDTIPFCSRVVFITGDAGHGKTALLKQYQARQARKFLDGQSHFLFWHVDLQGRQLLRLHEALMGDLGELRISGIWMAGIIRLLRHGMLVLSIDGFDELAAEQGRTDALGALASMVQQMGEKGVIVAAARRTFFDTEDYARRTGLIQRQVSSNCEFDHIQLLDWTRTEDIKYISEVVVKGKKFGNPDKIYTEILAELQNDSTHPMLTKPFLLARLSEGLLLFNTTPRDFIKGMQNPLEGAAEIVKSFIKREVSEKWKTRDGEPYLSIDQHMQLLANIAQEMWSGQVDKLPIDIIETITVILLDDWKIEGDRRRQVSDMVRMHVMLVKPSDGDEGSRTFGHPEFRNYFVAYSLSNIIRQSVKEKNFTELGRFLSFAQLPDSVAKYVATMLDKNIDFTNNFVTLMNSLVAREWKPTFLQTNIGTIMPYVLNGYDGDKSIKVKGNNVYSSLVFEKTYLRNIIFEDGSFLNVSFMGVNWENIGFHKCDFTEITLDKLSIFKNVYMTSCNIHAVKLFEDGDETRGYSPERIRQIINNFGIKIAPDEEEKEIVCAPMETEQRKLTNRLLRIFRRTILISDNIINLKIKKDQQVIIYKGIIPLMEKYGLIEAKPWRGGGHPMNLWGLKRSLDEILRADCGEGDSDLVNFWRDIDKL